MSDQVFVEQVAQLSPEQRAVVAEMGGGVGRGERRPLRILACAGSGKTKTIVTGIAGIVRQNILPGNEIILTTFTKAATQEMQHRLAAQLPRGVVKGVREDGARYGNRNGVDVTTFDSLALRRLLAAAPQEPSLQRPHKWSNLFNLSVTMRDKDQDGKMVEVPDWASERFQIVKYITLSSLWESIVVRGAIPGVPENTPHVNEKFKTSLDAKTVSLVINVMRSHGASRPDEVETKTKLRAPGPEIAYAWELYNAVKKNLGAWDFGDSLQAYHDYVAAGRDRCRFLVVDEAQDNNPLQMSIVRHLTQNHPQGRAIYVGDPRQSIYAFRGADPGILVNAGKPVAKGGEGAMTLELSTNYRSTPAIVECGNRVVAGEPWAVGKPATAARVAGRDLEFWSTGGPADRARRIAEDVSRQIADGAQPRDFAVLSRSRAAMGPLEVYFLMRNVPAKIQGSSPFFKIPAIARIMSVLRLGAGVGVESQMKADFWLLLRAFFHGTGPLSHAAAGEVWAAVKSPRTIYEDLSDWQDLELRRSRRKLLWGRGDATQKREQGFASLIDALGVVQQVGTTDAAGAVWAVAEILHKAELIVVPDFDEAVEALVGAPGAPGEGEPKPDAAEETDREMVGALREVAGSLEGLHQLCDLSVRGLALKESREEGGSAEEVARRREEEKNKVVVSTVHGAKGLEYPTVYLFTGVAELPAGGMPSDEELRILYVGVTRARDRLVMAAAGKWSMYEDRLRVPESDLETRLRVDPPKAKEEPKAPKAETEAPAPAEGFYEVAIVDGHGTQEGHVAGCKDLKKHHPEEQVYLTVRSKAEAAAEYNVDFGDDPANWNLIEWKACANHIPKTTPGAEVPEAPKVSEVPPAPPPEAQVDPMVADYIALRAVIAAARPDLLPLFDRYQTAVMRAMQTVRDEDAAAAELASTGGVEGPREESELTPEPPVVGPSDLMRTSVSVMVDGLEILFPFHVELSDSGRWFAYPPAELPLGEARAMLDPLFAKAGYVYDAASSEANTEDGVLVYEFEGNPPPPAAEDTLVQSRSMVDVLLPGKCYVQIRHEGRTIGGVVRSTEKDKPIRLPLYTPIVCENHGGAYSVGYASGGSTTGWQTQKEWANSHRAVAELGPYLDQTIEKWRAGLPEPLRTIENAEAAVLWTMAGGAPIKHEGLQYTAAGNEVPGSWRHAIDTAVANGFLRESSEGRGKSAVTTWEWSNL